MNFCADGTNGSCTKLPFKKDTIIYWYRVLPICKSFWSPKATYSLRVQELAEAAKGKNRTDDPGSTCGGALILSSCEKTAERPRTCWRDYNSWMSWEHFGIPQEELEGVFSEEKNTPRLLFSAHLLFTVQILSGLDTRKINRAGVSSLLTMAQ